VSHRSPYALGVWTADTYGLGISCSSQYLVVVIPARLATNVQVFQPEAPEPYIQEGQVPPFESGGKHGGTGLEQLQMPSGKLLALLVLLTVIYPIVDLFIYFGFLSSRVSFEQF